MSTERSDDIAVYVLDASVALKWFLPEPDSDQARGLLVRLLDGTDRLIVPDLLLGEVGHSLRVNLDRERLTLEQATDALDDLLQVPLEWVAAATVAREALQLVIAKKGPFFDAVYVALARARGCSVVASDRGMEEKYDSLGVVVPLSTLT